ncbi:hypothetical protein [Streptomyces parvulus]|uniref:hypothetical protein n=1 Tax=Streptomyces parvulus TaxID=146923 RepID=UPI0034106873
MEDLTAFYQALLDGELVSFGSLAEMKHTAATGSGLGLFSTRLSCGVTAWGHNGMMPGYHSYTLVAEDGRHASTMTNAAFQFGTPHTRMSKVLDTAICES